MYILIYIYNIYIYIYIYIFIFTYIIYIVYYGQIDTEIETLLGHSNDQGLATYPFFVTQ